MKKYILYLLTFLFIGFAATGCSDDDDATCAPNNGLVGEWRLVSWTGEQPEGLNVYLLLTPCSTFEIFQKIDTPYYSKFSGQYQADGETINGTYADGSLWAGYSYKLSNDGNTLTMTTLREPVEESVYTRTIIPEDVKNTKATRSGVEQKPFL